MLLIPDEYSIKSIHSYHISYDLRVLYIVSSSVMASLSAPFQFLPLGAIIQTFLVGKVNIVQNFPKQSLYQSHNDPYFGETIGRVANRIKGGKIRLFKRKIIHSSREQ